MKRPRVRGALRRVRRAGDVLMGRPLGSPEGEDLVRILREKIAPLSLRRGNEPRRINLLIPTIDLRYVFGGYIAKLNLARRLSEKGHVVRLVVVDGCDWQPAAWREQLAGFEGLQGLFDRVELTYAADRSLPLPVSHDDAFIATTWWTAHVAHRAMAELGREGFVYLIQEYEPFTFAMGSFAAVAAQTYSFPHRAVFSTEFLRDWFRQERLGVFREGVDAGERRSIAFRNAITAVGPVEAPELASRTPRRLLFYARPEPHAARNMYELGLLALREAVARGVFSGAWEFSGIGTVGRSDRIPLGEGRSLQLVPRLTQPGYRDLLRAHDLGLSLMYTPHPSLVPIEMASAGMRVVTNTFACKTARRLQGISPNLHAVDPTLQGVISGLVHASSSLDDVDGRVAGSRVAWSTDWESSFDDGVLDRITAFLGGDEGLDRSAVAAPAQPPEVTVLSDALAVARPAALD